MKKKTIPVHSINVSNGGIQQPVYIKPAGSIYSYYTGEFIEYGSIPYGIQTDAISGQSGYGKKLSRYCLQSTKWEQDDT